MKSLKMFAIVAAIAALGAPILNAEDAAEAPKKAAGKKQSEAASTTVTLPTIAKTNEAYTSAVDAHDLDGLKAKSGQDGAFKGTVSGIYEPASGGILIVNFDQDFKKAASAVIRAPGFSKFPDLKSLAGKEVLVSGKITLHRERPEIMLSELEQLKLVE